MNVKNKLVKGGAVLALSQLGSQLCSLGRNIIIARLVAPEDFGVASIFVMVIMLFEMLSNISIDRLLVQAEDGDHPVFQKVAHFLLAMRGMIIATILLGTANFLAKIFSVPQAAGSFYALGLVPLLNGFWHLDHKRVERDMSFWPGAWVELASQIAILILAWPLGKFFGDYRAMLWLLLVKSAVHLIATHIVGKRKYRWSLSKEYLFRFVAFGWPLLLNGLLMFAILQGDRFFVGSAKKLFDSNLGMAEVGTFSAALLLTMTPAMVAIKVGSSLFFPGLAKLQNRSEEFDQYAKLCSEFQSYLATVFCIFFVLTSDMLLPLIYGRNYVGEKELLGWLGILWALRMLRALPASIAMARGHTENLLKANIVRFLFLGGVIYVIINEKGLSSIAIVGVIGEIVTYLAAIILNKKADGVPYKVYMKATVTFSTCVIFVVAAKTIVLPHFKDIELLLICSGFFCSFLAVLYFMGATFKRFNTIAIE